MDFSFSLFLGRYFIKFCWCILGEQHQQKLPGFKVDSEISVATKDQQRQLPGSKVDSEISAATKDQQWQSPSSKVDSEISAAIKEK